MKTVIIKHKYNEKSLLRKRPSWAMRGRKRIAFAEKQQHDLHNKTQQTQFVCFDEDTEFIMEESAHNKSHEKHNKKIWTYCFR